MTAPGRIGRNGCVQREHNFTLVRCNTDQTQPKGAKPHHLIFVADPQITDPHSYPGRSWPLSSLTVLVLDNYLRRGYGALQSRLHPDSLFFLGDLFDGGREWKTRQGHFVDPRWGRERSREEKDWVDTWHHKYGDDYWQREYERFGDIFFEGFNDGGDAPGAWQRGRKLVASLPGNHDLGFGAQVQLPVRDRFEAYFGDVNRVDVVGNHTIVSVDAVSLSADTSDYKNSHNLEPIYGPVNRFLSEVQGTKRKAVQEELSVYHGNQRDLRFGHTVEELDRADMSEFPVRDPGPGAPDFPTILLTHVPLYREPGTPCGPKREHWPPQKPPKGQTEPVNPDHRNAISVTAGYQYQNVLSNEDSAKLVQSVGNVVHVFSGDDHDYCEVEHSASLGGVREITVKSISMAMGVPTPGFVMASLYNPVDADGLPLGVDGASGPTLQTHLCLLPNQVHTYMNYVLFGIVTLVLLAVRAALVPVFHLTPFALDPQQPASNILPVFKDKVEPPDSSSMQTTSSGTSAHHLPARLSATASRGRSASLVSNGSSNGSAPSRWQSKKSKGGPARRWGWGGEGGPRINLDEAYYDGGKTWRTGGRAGGRVVLGTVGREMWTTSWRVVWMAVTLWAWLARSG